MKLYANNRLLAEHMLVITFAILRNEGLGLVEAMEAFYRLLTNGIDIAPNQQAALHDYLRQVLADYDNQLLASPARPDRKDRQDSRGGVI